MGFRYNDTDQTWSFFTIDEQFGAIYVIRNGKKDAKNPGYQNFAMSNGGAVYNGAFDSINVFNRVLTDQEILYWHHATKTKYPR